MAKTDNVNVRCNEMYSKLVQNENDIRGMIAYGLYKQEKIDFINEIKSRNRTPSQRDFENFYRTQSGKKIIEGYSLQAEKILALTAGNLTKEKINESFDEKMPSAAKTFWMNVAAGLASTFLFSIIVAIVIFIGYTSQTGVKEIVDYLFTK